MRNSFILFDIERIKKYEFEAKLIGYYISSGYDKRKLKKEGEKYLDTLFPREKIYIDFNRNIYYSVLVKNKQEDSIYYNSECHTSIKIRNIIRKEKGTCRSSVLFDEYLIKSNNNFTIARRAMVFGNGIGKIFRSLEFSVEESNFSIESLEHLLSPYNYKELVKYIDQLKKIIIHERSKNHNIKNKIENLLKEIKVEEKEI